mgnify:CR=1 FL=1
MRALTSIFLARVFSPFSLCSRRKIFPKEWQLSLAIIGGYFGLYLFSKILPGGKKKEEPVAAATSSAGGMPSIESAEFGEWLGKEGNFEKLFA